MSSTTVLKQKIDMGTPNPHVPTITSMTERKEVKDNYGNVIGYKKWNDLYKRYDVYNSNNTLIGYYKWNDLYNRWEYHQN